MEYFLGWPGIGAALLNAIRLRQASAVAAMGLSLGLTFVLLNALFDLAYRRFDPRLASRQVA